MLPANEAPEPPQIPRRRRRLHLTTALGIWGIAVAFGFASLADYSFRPGTADQMLDHWPPESVLTRDGEKAGLLLFLHPKCPCSRATLSELRKIMQDVDQSVRLQVVLYLPRSASPEWAQTRHWRECVELSGDFVHLDPGGQECARFEVRTSGHVMLFDAGGALRFSGGITASRNHQGENLAATTLVRTIRKPTQANERFPVYGCPILTSCDSQCMEDRT